MSLYKYSHTEDKGNEMMNFFITGNSVKTVKKQVKKISNQYLWLVFEIQMV